MEHVEIVPEPEADEREAILAALAELDGVERRDSGAWGKPELEAEEELP